MKKQDNVSPPKVNNATINGLNNSKQMKSQTTNSKEQ
jgi:hypothetical protein